MASLTKRNGKYRVLVRRKGLPPLSKTFLKRSDAVAWGRKAESEIEQQTYKQEVKLTLSEALDRYEKEVIPKLRAGVTELPRLRLLKVKLGSYSLSGLKPSLITQYKNERLESVSPASVKRELGLLSRVFNAAIKDWHYDLTNPLSKVRMPSCNAGRERRLSPSEEAKLLSALSNTITKDLVLFALETAMRRGEIVNMEWQDVSFDKATLHIPETKTGIPRTIPLSKKALEILRKQPRHISGRVWDIQSHSVTTAFTRACERAGIEGLHFHDLRHERVSRLFEMGLNVVEVAAISGHRDLRMLQRYTHLRAEDLAKKLG